MSTQALSVARLIRVNATLTVQAAQGQNLSSLLVLGNSDVIDVVTRLRAYIQLSDVGTDFGTTAPEYLAAQAYFGQKPQPTQLFIGRWAKTASKGELIGAPVTTANQVITAWTAISSGGFTVTVDGGSPQNLTGLDFSAVTNLNGVASIINAALSGAAIRWDATYSHFVIESVTTGASSTVSFLTAPSSGTDISAMLAMRSTSSGAYVADGIAAETALAAATLFDARFGQQWYALQIPEAVDADHLAVGPFVEATTRKHFYGYTTQEAGCIVLGDTSNILYQMKQLGLTKSAGQYCSTNAYAIASTLGRILTTDWNAQNTAITLAYKQEPGIAPENLTETQAEALESVNGVFFASYDNGTAILNPKSVKVASGDWIDSIIGTDWLTVTIMTTLYNLLYTSPTKVPQTDAGMHILTTGVSAVCAQGVNNGLGAPGVWNSAGFGALQEGDTLDRGYYVYAAPVALQSQADRAARKAVPIQVAFKLGGAVHTADVNLTVNS